MTCHLEDIMPRLHAFVYGNVQGVFFRVFVRQNAQKLKLVGWVRNCDSGCVEVLAEGPRRALELLLKKLKAGPAAACVEHVDAEWEKESGEFEGFEIR